MLVELSLRQVRRSSEFSSLQGDDLTAFHFPSMLYKEKKRVGTEEECEAGLRKKLSQGFY